MHSHYLVIDIETCADDTALPLLDDPVPAANLRDPEKIAADIARKREDQRDRMSLDPFAGRIVCIGWERENGGSVEAITDPQHERIGLEMIAEMIYGTATTAQRHLIGFNLGFDLSWLMTRARLLGVRFPMIPLRRHNTPDYTDLLTLATCDGIAPDGAMRRTLHRICQRFGIPVGDPTNGSDVARMVAEGRWSDIEDHCRYDVTLTHALGVRLGVIER